MDNSYSWASCSKKEFGYTGDKAHLVRKGALNSLCGYSATHAEIWRKDSKKVKCTECTKLAL